MSEGSRFFEERSAVQEALRRIVMRLDGLDVPYAIVGGMAMFKHGFRRFTEDVNILVTPEGLRVIHEKLDGLGYLPPFEGSKHLRDTENGVKVEFLVTGGYPGDGRPKPVSYPNPADVAVDLGGVKYIGVPALIELKLASGMTGGIHRMKDFTDVVGLVNALNLPLEFADQMNPYVQAKYREIWESMKSSPIREEP